jgi:hypothetical protein
MANVHFVWLFLQLMLILSEKTDLILKQLLTVFFIVANAWIAMIQNQVQRLFSIREGLRKPIICYRFLNQARTKMYKNLLRYAKPIKINNSELVLAENQAVRKLKSAQRDLVLRAIKRHNARLTHRHFLATRKPSLYERFREYLNQRVFVHVRTAFMDHYRMAKGRWAGGENYINVIRDPKPYAEGYSIRAYSSNGKWSGLDAHFTIHVAPDWRESVQAVPGLVDAGSMLTTHVVKIQDNLWMASWIKQSIGFQIKTENGFIAQLPNGERVHGKTLNSITRQLQAKVKAKTRELNNKQIAKLSPQELCRRYGDVVITVQDSLNAGNCATGTEHWCNLYMDGRTSARVSEIVSNPGFNIHARQAIIQRIIRNVPRER